MCFFLIFAYLYLIKQCPGRLYSVAISQQDIIIFQYFQKTYMKGTNIQKSTPKHETSTNNTKIPPWNGQYKITWGLNRFYRHLTSPSAFIVVHSIQLVMWHVLHAGSGHRDPVNQAGSPMHTRCLPFIPVMHTLQLNVQPHTLHYVLFYSNKNKPELL